MTAGAVALPRPAAPPSLAPGLAEALKRLPDARWLDRLLRGRAWIALIAVALGGIVAMQVSMLKLNGGIGRAVEHAGTLERQNADLRASVSQLSSEERIQREAAGMGMKMPGAGDVRYVTARGPEDARRATQIMHAPSPTTAVTAPAAVPDPAVAVTPAATTTPQTAPPAATATPQPEPVATTPPAEPVQTAPPQPVTPVAAAPAGAAAAPGTP